LKSRTRICFRSPANAISRAEVSNREREFAFARRQMQLPAKKMTCSDQNFLRFFGECKIPLGKFQFPSRSFKSRARICFRSPTNAIARENDGIFYAEFPSFFQGKPIPAENFLSFDRVSEFLPEENDFPSRKAVEFWLSLLSQAALPSLRFREVTLY
jgi:hypothetical protein